ncbi:MAG: hypothetical protein ACD_18C00294G0001 [uncultured bacterium]|nr:MAG: hypothetical protein ACD_18C00294G0001 [uncultured bacterium]
MLNYLGNLLESSIAKISNTYKYEILVQIKTINTSTW